PKKCSAVHFVKGRNKDVLPFNFGIDNIAIVNELIHLGLPVTQRDIGYHIENGISKGRRTLYATVDCITPENCTVNPLSASKLYWAVSIPTVLYGAEVLEYNDSSLGKLERFHTQTAKHIQGLPKHTTDCASLLQIGWCDITEVIVMKKLVYFWHIFNTCAGQCKAVSIARWYLHF
ncbi:unnamed protein product, partial [Owenia fusiformis]